MKFPEEANYCYDCPQKERTYLNSRKVRIVIADLLSKVNDNSALRKTVDTLGEMDLDSNARSVLELLNRISSKHKLLPACYVPFLHELHLETPISALVTPYSSNRSLYKEFMDYLNNKLNILVRAECVRCPWLLA